MARQLHPDPRVPEQRSKVGATQDSRGPLSGLRVPWNLAFGVAALCSLPLAHTWEERAALRADAVFFGCQPPRFVPRSLHASVSHRPPACHSRCEHLGRAAEVSKALPWSASWTPCKAPGWFSLAICQQTIDSDRQTCHQRDTKTVRQLAVVEAWRMQLQKQPL